MTERTAEMCHKQRQFSQYRASHKRRSIYD